MHARSKGTLRGGTRVREEDALPETRCASPEATRWAARARSRFFLESDTQMPCHAMSCPSGNGGLAAAGRGLARLHFHASSPCLVLVPVPVPVSALLFSFFLSSCASRSPPSHRPTSFGSLPSRRPEPTVMSRWHASPTSYIRCHRTHSTAQPGLAAENPAVVVPKR